MRRRTNHSQTEVGGPAHWTNLHVSLSFPSDQNISCIMHELKNDNECFLVPQFDRQQSNNVPKGLILPAVIKQRALVE